MVRAAERAHSVPDLRLAIIGGLAVTCRLGHVHRATGDGEVADATNDGPVRLAEVVHEVIGECFVDGATRVVRYLKAYGDPAWPEITADDLRRVVGAFAARL